MARHDITRSTEQRQAPEDKRSMMVPIQKWTLPSSGHQMPGCMGKKVTLHWWSSDSTTMIHETNVFKMKKIKSNFFVICWRIQLLNCFCGTHVLHIGADHIIIKPTISIYQIYLLLYPPCETTCNDIYQHAQPVTWKDGNMAGRFSILIYFSIYATFPTSTWFLIMFHSTFWPILTHWGTPRKKNKEKS